MSNIPKNLLSRPLSRYGIAVVAVAVGFLLRQGLTSWVGHELPTYITFYPAVMVAALVAGFGPGVLATAMTTLLVSYWVLPAQGQSTITSLSGAVSLAYFSCMGVFMSVVAELYRRARQRVAAYEKRLALQESEEALRQHREWLRVTLNSIGDGVLATDTTGRITFLNPIAETLTGWKQDDALGQPVRSVFQTVNEKTHMPTEDVVERVLRAGSGITLANHTALITRDGREIPIEDSASPISDISDHVAGVVIVFHDVTEKRRAQERLAREQANLQSIFDVVNVALLLVGEDGVVKRVNNTVSRWFGQRLSACGSAQPGDIVGCVHAIADPAGCGHTPECAPCSIRHTFESVLRSGRPLHEVEAEATLAIDGAEARLWLEVSADPLVLDGKPHVILAMNNITARKQAEVEMGRLNAELEDRVAEQTSEIRKTYDLLSGVMAGTTDKIAAVDPEFRFTCFNDAYRNEFKKVYGVDVAIGLSLVEALAQRPEDRKNVIELFDRAMRGESSYVEHELGDPGRQRNCYQFHFCPIRDQQGRIVGAAHIARDITDRQRAETAVQHERRRLHDVLEILPVYVVLLAPDYHVPFANRFFRERFGDSGGKRCFEYLFGRAEPCKICETYTVLRTNAPHRWEWVGPDGRNYDVFDFPFTNADGSPLIMEMGIDVTERKRAEAALREANETLERRVAERTAALEENETRLRRAHELLEAVTKGTKVVIAAQDANLRYTFFNEAYRQEMRRLTGKEIHIGDSMAEVFAQMPEQQALAMTQWSRVLQDESVNPRVEFRDSAGHLSVYSVHHTPLRDALGNVVGAGEVALDVTEQVRSEQALRESQADLNRAQAVGQIGSWRLDVRRNELVWSDENHRIFDIPAGTPLTYETFLAMVHPEDREYVDRNWNAALNGAPYDIEHRIVVGDRVKWVCEKAELEFDGQGNLLGGFGTTQDITAKKQADEALAAAKTAAEAANVAKSKFLATMSHELRTPMNAILGMTDLALGEQLPPTVRDYLQTAKESADLLLELLNEILDFSRIEAGGLERESVPFGVANTVEQVVKALGVRAYEKGLEMVYELPDDLPHTVVGDPLRLRQVLTNLVGNAVKFTRKGEIIVRVVVDHRTADSVSLKFSVSDTGIGLAPEDRDRIFSPFTQAEPSTGRRFGGTGLGLAICQRLVAFMDGRIWVESEQGQGSTFYFTVTLPIAEQPAGQVEAILPDRDAFCDLPVLVIAESATSRRVLEQTLASWSLRPEVACDVREALTKIHRAAAAGQPYRLVLTDAVLPDIDGFTLARWLQQDQRLSGPVLLMLSPTDRQNYPDRCREAQAIWLDKPVSRSALFSGLTRALGLQSQVAQAAAGKAAEVMSTPARPLRVLLAEDTPANQKLVVHVLGKRGHTLEIADNGRQALDLLQQQDFDAVLMDVEMPEMDGLAATAAIRNLSDRTKARLPIIAMTAHALKGDQERCLAAGMNAYISKPIKGQEMIDVLERLTGSEKCAAHELTPAGIHHPQQQPARSSEQEEDATSHTAEAEVEAAFSREEAVNKCFGKCDVFDKMVGYFYDEADPLINQMRIALAHNDADELGRTAHRLKGTVVYLGAAPALEAAACVERIGLSGDLSEAPAAIERLGIELERLKSALESQR